ncbi:MAG TPA: glycoside hydrolase family 3 C-terminal domain-containing protein, partial [Balneolaceae bacterium]|nr:glycoside hydrolase family 3 C-terminal domain-containing protein [Balneolaceae bacterium]
DLNCGTSYQQLGKAVKQGLIKEETIDQSLQRLFEARYHLGMHDGQETGPYTDIPYSVVSSSENKQKSLDMSRESIVLLKNDNHNSSDSPMLPLSDDIKKLAVIGPNADDDWVMLGNYHGTPDEIITPLKGIKKKASERNIDVLYAQGCDIAEGWESLNIISSENLVPSQGSGSGLYGEYFDNEDFKGSPSKSRVDEVVDFTWKDDTPVTGKMADPFSVRWTGKLKAPKTGTYVIAFKAKNAYKFYFEGKLKAKSESEHDPNERRIRVDLKAGQEYPLKIEYINRGPDPQAHLSWSVPDRNLEAEAMDVAKQADAVILCMGLNSSLEGEEMPIEIEGFNGGDKTNLQLPATQLNLMKKLHSLGKPTVLVLLTGSAVTFPWAEQNIPAILEAWYGGQEGGNAIADVLFGDYNPGGRLPVTFYESIDDVPTFTDYSMDGRTYKYFEGTPFYPFGYGLSYTTFTYSDLQLPDTVSSGQQLQVEVTVKNTGRMAGDEVVQLYLSHPDATIRKPQRSLQGFERIHLQKGESQIVRFSLDPKQLTLVDKTGTRIPPKGHLKISVGGKQPGFSGRPDAQTTEVLEQTVAIG